MQAHRIARHAATALTLACALGLAACGGAGDEEGAGDESPLMIADDIQQRREQFMVQQLGASLDHLSPGDRMALQHLLDAADIMDDIFLVQAWAQNPEFAGRVAALDGPGAAAAQDYYRIMYGPWDRLEGSVPFLGDFEHPEGAGYYPEDMTTDEFESHLEANPDQREAFTGLHTMIRRDEDGGLVAIPYSEFFEAELEAAAGYLRQAAGVADDPTLAEFLRLRADAFLSDDYYASDMAWMDLAGDLEVVIGPYEVYEDQLFGYKAAFEAFLCVVDPEDSAALTKYKAELPWMEQNLPVPDEVKNPDRGSESPIKVADEVYTAGDTRAGVQTLAFNLPNDERVREAKGSKKVLLKNIMRAKYNAVLEPISTRVLPDDEQHRLDFASYFNFILFHELCHGLGPGRLVVDGEETEVRLLLKDLYSALEEAKADVMGIYNLHAMADKGVVDEAIVRNLAWTVVPGLFRSARFGTTEAHGLGVVVQINHLLESGAIEVTDEGRFRPVEEQWRAGIEKLTRELVMLQYDGDYDAAKEWVARYGTVPAPMQAILDDMTDIPVDIDPRYPAADQLRGR